MQLQLYWRQLELDQLIKYIETLTGGSQLGFLKSPFSHQGSVLACSKTVSSNHQIHVCLQSSSSPLIVGENKVLMRWSSCCLHNDRSSLISWKSRRQSVISSSSIEAKYRALILLKIIRLEELLENMGNHLCQPTFLYRDNKSDAQIGTQWCFS